MCLRRARCGLDTTSKVDHVLLSRRPRRHRIFLPVKDASGVSRGLPAARAPGSDNAPCDWSVLMRRSWSLLATAIVIEVSATLALRASQDNGAWLAVVVAGYMAAFVLLIFVVRAGMAVGVAYGIWGAAGTASTALLASVIFGDPFTWQIAAGIGLIVAGVLLVKLGSRPTAEEPT